LPLSPPFALLLLLVGLRGAYGTGALFEDPGFDAVGDHGLGKWQVRYALKASEPTSRPRWKVVPRVDKDPARGKYLSVEESAPAAGTVFIGQRVRLPNELPLLELAVDFQTYCATPGRSGGVAIAIFSVETWDALSTDPEKAAAPEEALFRHIIHPNGEKVTEWHRGRVPLGELQRGLAPLAGREVVVALDWNTWHPIANEWARFDSFYLGEPRPSVEAAAWPRWAYTGEPLRLTAVATGRGECRVDLEYRPAGEAEWQSAPMRLEKDGRFAATLPGEAVRRPLQVRAVLKQPDTREIATPTAEIRMTQRPEHPCLFYNTAELNRMREKIREVDWARATFDSLKARADAWVDRTDEPPAEPGGWSHNYSCPEDGARLEFRQDQPHKHLCPTCSEEWEGEKYDAVWRANIHGQFGGAARDLALTYQLTGESRYGRAAARLLLWYADRYADFPLGSGPAGKGRVMSQSLSECTWLLGMFNAADLAYPVLTDAERRHLEQDLIRAGAEHTSHYTFGIHNIQCWHNACLACAGYFLGDPDMVRRAREGKLGFDAQVDQGILEDGMWYERSMGYHDYTLSALVAHCEAARHAGEKLHEVGRIRRMFTFPLRLAQPNLVLPSLNDQGYTRGRIGPEPLERAVAWYGDAEATRALRMLYDTGAKRGGLVALQYGEALPDVGEYQPPGSTDLPGAGLVVLRQGKGGDTTCAMLEYGEHGGGHGHPDKLQLLLCGLGQTLCPDPGTAGYGSPLHGKWFKTTAAHNTVTVGMTSQKPTSGKLLAFVVDDRYAAATAESTGAYDGYRMVRRLLLSGNFLVDVLDVQGEKPDTLDWFLRAVGRGEVGLPLVPVTEKAPNATYAYLAELRGAETPDQWTASWEVDDGGRRLLVTMDGAAGTQVVHCLAPGVPGEPKWSTLRVRRRVATTQFAAVYQMLPRGGLPASISFDGKAIRVGDSLVVLGETPEAPLSLK